MQARTILLVEDNPQDEMLTLRSLRRVNFANQVHVVRDGQEALDYLFQSGQYGNDPKPVLPTVVILDLNLPKIGGLDVLERLRANERTHLVPVVIFTSSDEERDRLRCYEGRANSFVRKPLDFGEFAETVAKLGVYWVATNDPPGA
ncbi:MAG: response regulator [Burkholderiales bacterium]